MRLAYTRGEAARVNMVAVGAPLYVYVSVCRLSLNLYIFFLQHVQDRERREQEIFWAVTLYASNPLCFELLWQEGRKKSTRKEEGSCDIWC